MPKTWRNKLEAKREKNQPKTYCYKNLTIKRQPTEKNGTVQWEVTVKNTRNESFKVTSDQKGRLRIDFQNGVRRPSDTGNALFKIASIIYGEREDCKATLTFEGFNDKLARSLNYAGFKKIGSEYNSSKFEFDPFSCQHR